MGMIALPAAQYSSHFFQFQPSITLTLSVHMSLADLLGLGNNLVEPSQHIARTWFIARWRQNTRVKWISF